MRPASAPSSALTSLASPTAPPETAARFRADIQGMRALAVLAVIAGHAGLGPFPGGFVGVDVFFVISGFLITQLLLAEIARSGRISPTGFYARRARRILPAGTVVLVATVGASALFLGFLRVPDILLDAVWAALFAANVRFAATGTDYFAADLPPSPVQHFWSLAVEEQFYLVWPVLMIGVLAAAGRRSRRRTRGTPGAHSAAVPAAGAVPLRPLLVTIGLLSAASLAWSWYATAEQPTSAYFSTLTRAWELGVGAIAALLVHALPGPLRAAARVRPVAELVALAGLVAIAWSCLELSAATAFPGLVAAVPVLGTAAILVIGAAAPTPTLVARLLSVSPARVVGDWSYSLYLWHWPLLVVPQVHLLRELRTTEKLLLVGLTFALSALTYRLVETPFRTGRGSLRRWTGVPRALVLYPVSVVLVVAAAIGGDVWTDHRVAQQPRHAAITLPADWRERAEDRLGREPAVALVRESVRAARRGHGVPGELEPRLVDLEDSVAPVGRCDYRRDVRELCARGDTDADRTLVVVGDSHGRHWIPAFERIAQRTGWRTYYLVKPRCTAALVTPDMVPSNQPNQDCADFHEWMLDTVAELRPELAVVSSTGSSGGVYLDDGSYLSDPDAVDAAVADGFVRLLRRLGRVSDRVVMLEDVPELARPASTCLSTPPESLRSCLRRPDAAWAARTDLVGEAVRQRTRARWVETRSWFCHDGQCPPVVGATIPYRDTGHVTNEYSARLAEPLGRRLGTWRR